MEKTPELYDGNHDDIYKCKQPKDTQSKTHVKLDTEVEPGDQVQNCCCCSPNVTAECTNKDWDGDFDRADDGRLIRRREGRVPFVYAGVGIMKPSLFSGLDEQVLKLAPFFFEASERGRLFGVALEGTWLHVGAPSAISLAEAAFAERPSP